MRVVSLVPSATETLLALGAEVDACTRFCEQPHLRHVGGTKNPDLAAIIGLAPDLVVLDEEENRREDAEALTAAGLDLLVTAVRDVDGALDAVGMLAARVGLDAPRLELAPNPVGVARSAFVPIWRRPWMTMSDDTYGASLLARVGIDLVTIGRPERYPTVELDEVPSPDLVVLPSEPYAFSEAHAAELAVAFPGAEVVAVDGQDLFWWGIRTPAAAARLGEQLNRAASPG